MTAGLTGGRRGAPTDQPTTANPPGQPRLRRRVDTHASALARMRTDLADPRHDLAVRSLAAQGTDEVSIALLDAWAVVADVVAFYSERVATEGFLRTATQLRSVRELARTLGYGLRPGVAAQADLAFTVETAPGAPEIATVDAGTPIQSVPGPGQLPQTFETTEALEARGSWNVLPVVDAQPQALSRGVAWLWLRGALGAVRPGDSLLIRGARSGFEAIDHRQVRRVQTVAAAPEGLDGWLQVGLDQGIAVIGPGFPAVLEDLQVDLFGERARLFGANAPDPNLLVVDDKQPPGSVPVTDTDSDGVPDGPPYAWAGYGVTSPLEVDGDHPGVLKDSWLALRQGDSTEIYAVTAVVRESAAKWTVSGPVTIATLTPDAGLAGFDRQRVSVLCTSSALAGGEQPDLGQLTGRTLVVAASDPPLPPGRRVLLRGREHLTDGSLGPAAVETATVATCDAAGSTMTLVLEADLITTFARQGLEVLANVAVATHGETARQVLGSGDGRTSYATFRPRRPPLTYVRDTTPAGAHAELTVRVDGVAWAEVGSLDEAGPDERAYVVQHGDDGAVRVVTGDGVHGARPATGQENVTATYRVGIGATGAVEAGQLSLLPRRPFGVRAVTNLAPSRDWAAPETIEEARGNAPVRVRALDRAVSPTDYEDVARGYAGVGPAHADVVWDGRAQRILLSLLASGATTPSVDLVADLRHTLDAARDPACPLDVLAGEPTWFGVRVEVAHDPARDRDGVLAAVELALEGTFGAPVRPFASPVTAAGVLLVVRGVAGVTACTMPRVLPVGSLPAPPLPPTLPVDGDAVDVLTALPGRWDGAPRPAQLLALAPGGIDLREMP